MAKPIEYNATLTARIDLTDKLAIFKIRPDEPYTDEAQWFEPGQYVTLGMNNEENPDLGSVRRPMSIVSAPQERDEMEFYIRYVDYPESDNPLTHLMWKASAGDRMHLRPQPTGKFTVDHTIGHDDPRLRICVAAGTGMAPFVSMARCLYMNDPKVDMSNYVILHGASYPADLGYVEEMKKYQEENGLRYFGSVSRPNEAPDWTGDKGRVEDYFLPERLTDLEERLGLGAGEFNRSNAAIFICGLTGTIGMTLTRLIDRGFAPETRRLRRVLEVPDDVHADLFYEQYDSTPVIDVKNPELVADLKQRLHSAWA